MSEKHCFRAVHACEQEIRYEPALQFLLVGWFYRKWCHRPIFERGIGVPLPAQYQHCSLKRLARFSKVRFPRTTRLRIDLECMPPTVKETKGWKKGRKIGCGMEGKRKVTGARG